MTGRDQYTDRLDEIDLILSKIDLSKLYYDTNKKNLCEALSTSFEKNWGSFMYKKKLHMLYDINPLKILEVNDDFNLNTDIMSYNLRGFNKLINKICEILVSGVVEKKISYAPLIIILYRYTS